MGKIGYLTRDFFSWMLSSLALIATAFSIAAYIAYTTTSFEAAQQVQLSLEQRFATATGEGIFMNNLFVSWSLIVPIVGVFPFLFFWYSTGWHVGALAVAYDASPLVLILRVLSLGFMEILAYTVMLGENLYTSTMLFTNFGNAVSRIKNHYWKSIIIYLLLLFLAAIMETSMLK